MQPEVTRYAAALGEAARLIQAPGDLGQTLDAIVSIALDAAPDFDHAGIACLVGSDRLVARAAAGELVGELVRVESSGGDGPCLTALRDDEIVTIQHARQEQRWPEYVAPAVAAGVRSQIAIRLDVESGDQPSCLIFCSTSSDVITDEAKDVAASFATLAGLALTQRNEVSGLEEALRSRKTIGVAVGLLMERLGIDEERAFAYLVRESSYTNTKLREVAAGIVDSANGSEHRSGTATSAASSAPRPTPPSTPNGGGQRVHAGKMGGRSGA